MFLDSYLEEFNDFVLSVGKHRQKGTLTGDYPPTPIHGGREEVTEEKCVFVKI